LIYASHNGHLNIVQCLVSKGVNIEAKEKYIFIIFFNGKTAMDLADDNEIDSADEWKTAMK
jgi:ankyrin repeat protein